MIHRVTRWNGAVAAAVFLGGLGVGSRTSGLVLAAFIPLAYVAYGAVARAPAVRESLSVERHLEASTVPPGRPVEVTLTVRHTGDRTLTDVRVVDGVPAELRVQDGSPRAAGTLRPDESLTVSYRLQAKRGIFTFDAVRVRARSVAATALSTVAIEATGDDRLTCRLDADAPPLEDQAGGHAGQLSTDQPGEGVEFHSIREYEPGDRPARIDWRHYAKRDDLATVSYREHRSADVVLVVDAREPCRAVAGPGHPSAVELAAYAATRAIPALGAAGHEVGVAVVGVPSLRWLEPGGSRGHRARARDRIASAADTAGRDGTGPTEPTDAMLDLPATAPPGAQLLLFSPLLDDPPVGLIDGWLARGAACGVVAPDVLADNTMGGQVAGTRRAIRLIHCRTAGAQVVDWRRGTPLPLALETAIAGLRRAGWS